MNSKSYELLLGKLLNDCNMFNSPKCLQEIFKVLYVIDEVQVGQLDHITRATINPYITDSTLRFLINAYDDKGLVYYVENFRIWDGSPEVIKVLNKLDEMFDTPAHTYRYLYGLNCIDEEISGKVNNNLKDWLEGKVEESALDVAKPFWVKDYFGKIVSEKDLRKTIPEENVSFMIS